jgi:hypothetical protein
MGDWRGDRAGTNSIEARRRPRWGTAPAHRTAAGHPALAQGAVGARGAGITISGALIWALYQGNRTSAGGPELYNIENKTTPDGPNGRSIVLERQPGADTQGFAGLEDEVDHHWSRLAMAAALSTVLGVGAELGAANNDSAIVTALRRHRGCNQTGQRVVRPISASRPTITTRRLSGPRDW